jgi:hypothetical protein
MTVSLSSTILTLGWICWIRWCGGLDEMRRRLNLKRICDCEDVWRSCDWEDA